MYHHVAYVKPDTLEIASLRRYYPDGVPEDSFPFREDDSLTRPPGPDEFIIPDDLEIDAIQAVREPETGAISIVTDPVKFQKKREYWLPRLREDRNKRLSESDWTQISDAPLTEDQKTAWRTYRQSLRDLPASTNDPSRPVWPSRPVS
jgi:hypothetical protein